MLKRGFINSEQWVRHTWQNRLQTLFLLLFLGGYLLLLGWMILGEVAAIWFLLFGGFIFLSSQAGSPHLLMKLSHARLLSSHQAPELHSILRKLSIKAGLSSIPALYYLPTRQPNALAIGSRHEPVIAVSDGLLRILNPREMACVLAHEISHLRNDDIRTMQLAELAGRLTNCLSLLGQGLLLLNLPLLLFADYSVNLIAVLLLVFAPQISTFVQLGLSRIREYDADLGAVRLTGDPEGLANALWKLNRREKALWKRLLLPGNRLPVWLRTHPPTGERVRRLLALRAKHVNIINAGADTETLGVRGRNTDIAKKGPDLFFHLPLFRAIQPFQKSEFHF